MARKWLGNDTVSFLSRFGVVSELSRFASSVVPDRASYLDVAASHRGGGMVLKISLFVGQLACQTKGFRMLQITLIVNSVHCFHLTKME